MERKFFGKIEDVSWNLKKEGILINGFCFIDGSSMRTEESVKKSIIITNGNKRYVIKANNVVRQDITTNFGGNVNVYDYAGFSCFIDLGFIDEMKPLAEGVWNVEIYLNASGEEYEGKISCEDLFNNTTARVLGKGKFTTAFNLINDENKLTIEALSKAISPFSLEYLKTSKFYKKIHKCMKKFSEKLAIRIYKLICWCPIKEGRVSFLTDSRGGLYGNFRLVNDELVSRGITDIKYMLKPHDNMKKTIFEKFKLLYYIATSEAILLDDYYPFLYNIKPKNETKLVQLWHAPGAFKTFGFTRAGKLGWSKNPRAKNHRSYTHAIVSSTELIKHYAEAYAISMDKVYATGVPRTDMFFDEEYKDLKIKELYEKYPILKDKKVIMFAPTFRGKGRGGYYDFVKLDIDALKNSLGDEYVLIMKLHPFISNMPSYGDKYKDFMIDLSHENEINDLLLVSDVMITDYSSVCFEFSLLNRPMIFFSYDMEDYIEKRDFYYPYESFVPGPIVKDTEGIISVIKNEAYELDKLDSFRNKFFDHFDGKSTERVVDMILK